MVSLGGNASKNTQGIIRAVCVRLSWSIKLTGVTVYNEGGRVTFKNGYKKYFERDDNQNQKLNFQKIYKH